MDLGLKGKNAIITGASQGIGQAIAFSLAAEGCNVAIGARDQGRIDSTVAEIESKGVKESASSVIYPVKQDVRSLLRMPAPPWAEYKFWSTMSAV